MWIHGKVYIKRTSLSFSGGSDSKESPEIQETWAGSLGWEDPLEEGMATHSSILAWGILWTEEPGGLQSMVTKIWTRVTQLSRHILIITQ